MPEVQVRDNVRVRVGWEAQRNQRWEVSVTVPGVDPEDGRRMTVTSPFVDLYGLWADSTYSVYVRGWCSIPLFEGWSDWSAPLSVAGTLSVPEVDGAEAGFELTPNPASGTVTVGQSVAAQGTVTVLDLQGRQLLSVPISGTSATVDISTLPPATYIVLLATDHGTASRKLTVQ